MANYMYSIHEINKMGKEAFIEKIGWVFEHSPWIATKAWNYRPFASMKEIHQAMVSIVKEATTEDQLELIRVHPDLGSRIQMTESSVQEQKNAGLDQLSEEEYHRFLLKNREYLNRFRFPFILAVKGHNKESIYTSLLKRIDHSKEEEFHTALEQIYLIAKYRLETIINKDTEEKGA